MNAHPGAPDRTRIARIFALQQAARSRLKASSAAERCARLQALRRAILARAGDIDAALHDDLRKPLMGEQHFETLSVLQEIDTACANLAAWMEPSHVEPSPHFAGNRTYVAYEPRGVCLLFGAWNFPFFLSAPIFALPKTSLSV